MAERDPCSHRAYVLVGGYRQETKQVNNVWAMECCRDPVGRTGGRCGARAPFEQPPGAEEAKQVSGEELSRPGCRDPEQEPQAVPKGQCALWARAPLAEREVTRHPEQQAARVRFHRQDDGPGFSQDHGLPCGEQTGTDAHVDIESCRPFVFVWLACGNTKMF